MILVLDKIYFFKIFINLIRSILLLLVFLRVFDIHNFMRAIFLIFNNIYFNFSKILFYNLITYL